MKSIKGVYLLVCVLFLSACSSLHQLDRTGEKAYWMTYKPDQRGAIFTKNEKFCSEQAADAAFNSTFDTVNKLAADIAGKADIGVESKVSLTKNVVQLAQKSQAVLMQRESMYRICELSLNGFLGEGAAERLFLQTLEISKTIALAEVATALNNENIRKPTESEEVKKEDEGAEQQKQEKYRGGKQKKSKEAIQDFLEKNLNKATQ